MQRSYRVNFKPPKPAWQSGVLSIMRAFHGLPPDLETWHISDWSQLVKDSHDIIKNSAGGML